MTVRDDTVAETLPQRREVLFAGRVQGVGFRYTAQRIAAGYAIGGFVRNLRDGRVQIVMEGQPQEMDGFLEGLRAAMRGYVREMSVYEQPATGEFPSFEVRY